jgi:hypothetical protein
MNDTNTTPGSFEKISEADGFKASLPHLDPWVRASLKQPRGAKAEPSLEFRYVVRNGDKLLQYRHNTQMYGTQPPITEKLNVWLYAPKDIPEIVSENKKIANKGSVWLVSAPNRTGFFTVYVTHDVFDTDDVVFVKDVTCVFPNPFFSAALEFDSKNQVNIDDRILSIKTSIDNASVNAIPFSHLIQEMKLPD